MRRSFQRRLLLHIGGAVMLLGLVAAVAQFVLAWRELREFQDDMLRQVAALALTHPGRDASSLGRLRLGDNDSRIQLAMLPADPAPAWFDAALGDGLHTVDSPAGRMRVFVERSGGHTAIAAQPTDARDELAWNGAWRALLPSLALVPLLIWLISRVVRGEFAPIARAAGRIAAQRAVRESGLGIDEDLPVEIQPFVEAIDGLLQRTHDLVRQQQRFIADAAHELRSPLTALALQAGNVRKADSLEEARNRLRPLEAGIARARKLTEQLLGLARMESGKVEDEPVDLGGLALELLAEFHTEAQRRRIDLGLDAPDPITANTSRLLLRTILSNALDNALKYTPEGGEVTLAIRRAGDTVQCEVVDSGPGIAPSERAAVFQPFHRLHGNAVEGTGLGLAIASEAAGRLGAKVSLHDRPGRGGLVFRLELGAPDMAA